MEKVEFTSGRLRIAGALHLPDASRFAPPYPAVVICHGIGSCKESHSAFADFLAHHGLAALAFDLRGHGESEGQLDDHVLDDITAALDWLSRRPEIDRSRLGLRGSSMGAMLALHAAVRDPRVRAVTAIAPAVEALTIPAIETGELFERLGRVGLTVRIDPSAYVRYLRSHDSRGEVHRIAPRPLLLIHCKGDELIPYTCTEELFHLAHEPKKLVLIEGGHHRFAQQDASAGEQTAEWFKRNLQEAK